MKQLLLPLALVWTCCTAASAPLPSSDERSTKVAYSDLDLSSAHGQAALQRRIDGAVRRVCSDPNSRSLHDVAEKQACESHARLEAANGVSNLLRGALGAGGATGAQTLTTIETPGWL